MRAPICVSVCVVCTHAQSCEHSGTRERASMWGHEGMRMLQHARAHARARLNRASAQARDRASIGGGGACARARACVFLFRLPAQAW